MPGWRVGLYCFEVGQASCAALIDPIPRRRRSFQATVIDAGGAGAQLAQRLDGLGVQRIAAIALTHNDGDHIRGLTALVQAYRGRVGDVWLLTDRGTAPHSIWMPVQQWLEQGWTQRIRRLEAPAEAPPGVGEDLLNEQETAYRLYCIYPSMFDVEAVVHGAERLGEPLGRGPNAVSAVLRLTLADAPAPTLVLFGGDLDYPGWRHLHLRCDLRAPAFVVPHHGGSSGATAEFGAPELADAVRPRFALISVGSTNDYGHPHAFLIRDLRRVGASVLCTQITPQCVADPGSVHGGAVLPRAPATPRVGRSGTACAGTVVLVIREGPALSVERLAEHQAAVDQLHADGHHPLCRP
jgi:competence protein ComEC